MSERLHDTAKRWVIGTTAEPKAETDVSSSLKLHPVAARVLVNRGQATPDLARAFLSDALTELPDPFSMKGLPEACGRILRAIGKGEHVTLWGDYDVDGVCSTALLTTFLGEVGLRAHTYIPHRLGEGYGLNGAAIEKLASEGTTLLVTLDCGITSHSEIALANRLGLDVIVVDHHAVPDEMPPAVAVLNPLQPGCEYPTKWLCAAGVCFNLVMGLRKRLRDVGHFAGRAEPNLKMHLDLVALATVADVVPLTQANRVLVRHGLEMLTQGRRPGVRALKDVALLSGVPITAGHVGFRLGPRINAAGRLDDAGIGLQCLLATNYEAAIPLARSLDAANAERQQIERTILEAAIQQAEGMVAGGAKGLVLAQEGWHPGVVGIVASRIVERFHRPTIVVGLWEGMGRGSARSIEGFHLHHAISRCQNHLVKFGGHKAAAGLSVRPESLDAFRAAFEAVCAAELTPQQLQPKCRVDAVVAPDELTEEAVAALQTLAPFGMGNPEPVLAMCHERVAPRVLEAKVPGETGHLKLTLERAPALDCIGFRFADRASMTDGPVDLAFQVGVEEFRGVRRVGLKLKDLRVSEPLA